MGKIRTKIVGDEEAEKKQAEKAKVRREAKKIAQPQEDSDKDFEPAEKIESLPKSDKKKKEDKNTSARARGKKYRKAKAEFDSTKAYSLLEAITLLKKNSYAKFDESFELHLNLLTTSVSGQVSLPHGSGKTVRVAIVDDKLIEDITDGKIEFDILVAHPSFMPKLAKVAKILGPRGLMPNPKTGTVSEKPEELAKKFAGGSLRFKSEAKFPILHQVVGKKSFEDKQLVENVAAFLKAVDGKNITSAYLKTSMSPSVLLQIN